MVGIASTGCQICVPNGFVSQVLFHTLRMCSLHEQLAQSLSCLCGCHAHEFDTGCSFVLFIPLPSEPAYFAGLFMRISWQRVGWIEWLL